MCFILESIFSNHSADLLKTCRFFFGEDFAVHREELLDEAFVFPPTRPTHFMGLILGTGIWGIRRGPRGLRRCTYLANHIRIRRSSQTSAALGPFYPHLVWAGRQS